jgi:hypothetical protein
VRLITFILCSAIALTARAALSPIAARAFAVTATASQAVISASNCPIYEGYPDCHPDDRRAVGAVVKSRTA